jgi:hypothetical protein
MVVAAMLFCIFLLPTEAQAATSGTCGDNLTWTLDNKGTLTISGSGAMSNYNLQNGAPLQHSPWYRSTAVKNVVIEDGVTSIGIYAFESCSNLTSITIPDSVTEIGAHAFYFCTSLTSITIPGSVTNIGGRAFTSCTGLSNVTIIDGVETIGALAFHNCTGLDSIAIPDSVTEIGENAFSGCLDLTDVYITDIAAWCNIYFEDSSSNPLDYASNLYLNGTLITDLIIPNGITAIGDYAFYSYDKLTSVTIPGSVKSIGDETFSNCHSLTGISIGNGVTSIGDDAFCGCNNLVSITVHPKNANYSSDDSGVLFSKDKASLIKAPAKLPTFYEIPAGTKYIEEEAFCDCSNLKTLVVPVSLEAVHQINFHPGSPQYSTLSNIYYLGTETQWAKISIANYNRALKDATVVYNYTVCKHAYGQWTKANGDHHSRICSACRVTQSQSHIWSGVETTAPTCKSKGVMSYTCTTCGATKTEAIPVTNNHTWNEGTVDKEATCGKIGAKTHICIVCGDTKHVLIPATGDHSCGPGVIIQDPTCGETGLIAYTCSVCQGTMTEAIAETANHTYKTEWEKDSSDHWHECSVCGAKKDEAAHIPGPEATTTTPQTCTKCGYEIAPVLMEEKNKDNGGGIVVIAAIIAVAGAAVIGGMILSKKKKV